MKKVLLIRLDKIGDLVCTLPVDEISELQNMEVLWVVAKGMGFIPTHSFPKRKFIEIDSRNIKKGMKEFEALLKEFSPEMAVSFQGPWWISWLLWKAKTPLRVGVLSQWHSFLFFNSGLRQKRSLADQHESTYNSELMRYSMDAFDKFLLLNHLELPLMKKSASILAPPLTMIANTLIQKKVLLKWELSPKNYMVVHPGMAGSAKNWPIKHYIEFIDLVLGANQINQKAIVMTGTAGDISWIQPLRRAFLNRPHFVDLSEKLTPEELLVILENAALVLAPSTGVLHLAASLSTPSLGLYSPIRVQHPCRWGARGKNVSIILPEVSCPEKYKCRGPKCPSYDCMDLIDPKSVWEQVKRFFPQNPDLRN